MTNNIFKMQADFMRAGDVKFPDDDIDTLNLCWDLIDEEYEEFSDETLFSIKDKNTWNELKEVCDLIIVCANKLNIDVGEDKALLLLQAVMRNNMSKCVDGKLIKREDGKILKPDGFDKMGWMKDFEGILLGGDK